VIVVGAGSGGIAAALQAARMGARVLVLEETDYLGGQIAAAGVTSMDGGGDLPATWGVSPTATGIHREFVQRVRDHYGPRPINTCYGGDSVCFEPHVGRDVLLAMMRAAGIGFRLGTRVDGVVFDHERVGGVVTEDGDVYRSHVVIDATEAGDVIPMTGARYRVGNVIPGEPSAAAPRACIQDITQLAVIRRYDPLPPEYLRITTPPPGYSSIRFDFTRMTTLYGNGSQAGYPGSMVAHNQYRGMPDSTNPVYYTNATPHLISRTGVNFANDYPGHYVIWEPRPGTTCPPNTCDQFNPGPGYADCCQLRGVWRGVLEISYLEDRAERRRIDCQARLLTLQFLYYYQSELSDRWSVATDEGYDTPYNRDSACDDVIPEELRALEHRLPVIPYIRESRRIVPIDTLTAAEMRRPNGPADPYPTIAERTSVSSIAVGEYGTDLHNCHSTPELECNCTLAAPCDGVNRYCEVSTDRSGGGYFQVPWEAMIPQTVDGFLVAEKNIGVSRLVNGATRLQPITIATGQAAGAIAALAVRDGIEPRYVAPLAVQLALVDAGAGISVYPYIDVPRTHEHWADIQIASTRGLMIGSRDPRPTAGDTAARPLQPFRFRPDVGATRAESAIVMAGLFHLYVGSPPRDPSFRDVDPDHFAYEYVEALHAAGIAGGCATDLFCPDRVLTRIEAAVWLVEGLHLPPVPDDGTCGDVAPALRPYAQAVVAAGLIDLLGSGFDPGGEVSNGALARVVRRTLTYELEH
jgi:hypothetical protein